MLQFVLGSTKICPTFTGLRLFARLESLGCKCKFPLGEKRTENLARLW